MHDEFATADHDSWQFALVAADGAVKRRCRTG
jgi:hypothetical protein